ncbi:serine/threonine-protein kinase LATS1 [Poecilia reticulata]|uniref:serine/threonine-protein kinase LATS1 n=1 Tax=Poecilia reticulata TaxID=8081 RepID=UPI0004A21CC4|nr:PREDICTED: serine/threonine-protein kinase LATS1 [Poecilia reticulata]XP_017157837.1 PREDICTED: serine/threonine-protein kinase LATS1 [Poecilia reticulata]
MRRAEKPEGHRQMRPKTFPASNYSGNSQQMLQEIRNSLRNLTKPSDPPKVDPAGQAKMLPEDQRHQGRSSTPKHSYHKALQEIRKSLVPFEVTGSQSNDSTTSGPDLNKLEQPTAGFEEGNSSRRVIYQDSMREQMAAANTNSTGLKAPGPSHMQQAVLRRPSWKGSKESLAPRMGPLVVDGMMYRSDSPGPPPVYPQGHSASNQRVNPPLPPQVRSVTPPPNRNSMPPTSSWESNPSTKRYSGNLDYLPPRMSPVPQGPRPDMYPNPAVQNQRSAPHKFTFPPTWTQNGSAQPDYMQGGNRQPPPPYSVNSRQGSNEPQPASSPSYLNGGNVPQSMLVPNRNSHNLDMYNLAPPQTWSQPPLASSQPHSASVTNINQDLSPSWQHNIPARSNSFNNRPTHSSSSQPSATTVTAITQTPILQPVKSMRVPKPEMHTAVAPTHPQRIQQVAPSPPAPAYPDPQPAVSQAPVGGEPPNYQGPPPPYPKHLLPSPAPPAYSAGRDEATDESSSEKGSESSESSAAAEKKITTSPVPVRRNRDEERRGESGRISLYSPQAFKFFMEQHVENILKNHQMRIRRRKQLESEMQRVGLSSEAQEQMRMMLSQKESNYIRLKRAKMDKSMFKRIKTLGIGAFGEVSLARKEDTGALYAMKTLRKKDVLLRNQVAHVKAERDILAEADNEWVVRLYYSFQDKDNLYFVMEYIPGGDMMSLLIRLGIFKEELAQFYIAELTCALESVHKMGFIHRDIKPDNILIDGDGHIKLTDFGLCTGFRWTHDSKYYQSGDHVRQDSMDFSKDWEDPANCRCSNRLKPLERRKARQHQRCLAHSLVGTPNYIAPEVLLRTGYTQLCDWWSVGVILYEMVVGQPPFLANTPLETQMKVITWKSTLHIPPHCKLSPEASDLIVKLCRGPEDRLGKNGADEIKAHPFFKSVNFSSDLRQQAAPYIPTIAHPTDTSNFDPVEPEKLRKSDDESNHNDTLNGWFRNGKHPEHAFYEFTFRRFFDDNGHPYSCPKPIESEGSEEDEAELDDAEQDKPGRDLVYV